MADDFTLAATGVTPYDPYSPMAKLAAIGQQNVATQGQQISNQGAQLGLLQQQARLAPFLSALRGQSGGLAAMGAPGAMQPVSQGGLAAMAPASGGGSPAGGALGAALGASGQPAQGGQPQAVFPPGPGDVAASYYGVAMPTLNAIGLSGAKDPSKALADAQTLRSSRLYQEAASSYDQNSWNQGVQSLYQEGWLSSQQANQFINRFDLRTNVLKSTASPDAGLSSTTSMLGQGLTTDTEGNPMVSGAAVAAKGAVAGAEATGRNRSDLTYKPQIDAAENGPLVERAKLTAGGTAAAKAPYDDPVTVTRDNPDGSKTTYTVPRSTWAAQNGAGGAGSGAPPASIGSGKFAPAALDSISNPNVRAMATNAALQAGLPPEAWPAWISAVHNESSWKLNQPDGAAGEIGPGQVKPGTGAMLGYNEQQLRVPQTNLLASAQYFKQQWGASNGDPAGALRGYNGGNPSVTAAQPYADRAIARAQQWTGGGASLGASSAAQNTAPLVSSNVGPAAPIQPVAAAGGRVPLIHADERFPPDGAGNGARGNVLPPANGPSPPTNMPAPAGQIAPSPQTPGPPQGPLPPPPPANDFASMPGVITGQTPSAQQLAQMKAQTENDVSEMGEYRKGLVTQAQAAAQMNTMLDQMTDESHGYRMGWGAETIGQGKAVLDGIAKTLGIPESNSFSQSLGSQQAFNKNAAALARTAAAQLGTRTGAQELAMIQKNLPSDEMSSQAFQRVTTQLGGISDYMVAKAGASARATGNPASFEASWNANVSPTAFVVNRMPPDDLSVLHANLIKTPAGQATWASLKAQVQYAQQNGLFGPAR